MKDLIEKRARLFTENEKLLTKEEELSAEDRIAWEERDTQIGDLTAEIEVRQQQAIRSEQMEQVRQPAVQAHVGGTSDPEYRSAWLAYLTHGEIGPELRAQGVATGAAGGFLVPEDFRATLIETLKQFGGVRGAATVLTTAGGNDLPYPTNDDTANVGVILAENTAVTEQDTVIGEKILRAFKYTSKLIRVSNELIQDSAFDIMSLLARIAGTRIGRGQAGHFVTGTGTGQPEGIQTNAAVGAITASGATTGFGTSAQGTDVLLDLVHSVDPAYRPGASFVMNDNTLAKVRKLKDADGRSIWVPSFEEGQSNRLLGHPVITDQAMPNMAASAKAVLFADVAAAYVIRDVAGIRALRLTERYADFDQQAVVAFLRSDGQPQQPAAVRALQNAAI